LDGDCPNLEELVSVSTKHDCYLVVGEAHALGVLVLTGLKGFQMLGLQDHVLPE
jgi:8-amino-7-oxononanoate synthase